MVRQHREEQQRPCERQTVLGFKNDSGLMEDGKECEDEMKCARPGPADRAEPWVRAVAQAVITGYLLIYVQAERMSL